MKPSFCVALALALVFAAVAVRGEPSSKPQGLTLRLELFVTDMDKSIAFYTKVLGFERTGGEPDYVPVHSGAVQIGLGPAKALPAQHHFNPEVQNGRRGLGTEIVLEVDDVASFFKKVKASGYQGKISPLRQQSWGLTDFRIVDPDGYYLRITSR